MNFDFGEVLTRAWQIVWKHRVLWIFGILASCGRGGGGGGNFGGGSGGDNGFDGSGADLPPQFLQWFEWIQNNLTQFIAISVALLCVIWIVIAFLSTIGKVGLIHGTAQVEGGVESLIFGQLFSESTPYFWRMFGLALVMSLPFLIVIVALAAGLSLLVVSAIGENNVGLLASIPLFLGCLCLLIPLMLVVGMIIRQSERAIVLEDLGVMPAISRGWEIFRANLGPIILLTIMLAIIGVVVSFIIAIPIFIVVFPALFAFALSEAQSWTPMIFVGVCICLFLPVALILNGIMTSYIETVWTLTYMRLTKPHAGKSVAPVEANA